MTITGLEIWHTRIPFSMGAPPTSFAGVAWTALDTVWLRVVTDQGIEGWGEGFGHACCPATHAALVSLVGPAALGQDARGIRAIARRSAETFHLFGRNGPLTYALSALDMALWDIAAKAAGLPLCRLLGAAPASEGFEAYASLLRYATEPAIAAACEVVLARGYRQVKLHEVALPTVRAARAALGPGAALMLDTNCPWTVAEAVGNARALRDCNLTWLEEPVWPPEDHAGLARVRREGGVPIAAGENAAGLMDFFNMFQAGALDIAQPSVAKVGGVTEVMRIAALADGFGVRLIPHCAYYGAGWLASMHLHAALCPASPYERIFIDLEASPYHELVDVKGGRVTMPEGPGLGRDPDLSVLHRYATAAPVILRA